MRVASCEPVVEIVAGARTIWLDDLPKVASVVPHRQHRQFVNAPALPVRQHEEHCEPGDDAAERKQNAQRLGARSE